MLEEGGLELYGRGRRGSGGGGGNWGVGVTYLLWRGNSEDACKHRNASSLQVNNIAYLSLSLIASIVHVKHSECHVGRSSKSGFPAS